MIHDPSIRQWFSLFKEDNTLVEVRVLGSGKKTFSGYFADVDSLINAIRPYDGFGIYATINAIKQSCWGRSQTNQMMQSPKSTTSDTDIDYRTTLLIDIDPKRPSDTNASDDVCEVLMLSPRRYIGSWILKDSRNPLSPSPRTAITCSTR